MYHRPVEPPPAIGVILAGGRGTRMHPLSAATPKTLLPVGNTPLIEWQVLELARLGIREVLVVIGDLGHCIREVLGDGARLGVRIQYVQQDNPQGIAHAVGLCEPLIDGPFLLLLGDIYFVAPGLRRMFHMLDADAVGGVLGVCREEDPAAIQLGYSAVLAPDGRVQRVIEKPRHPPTKLKGCGIYLFDVRFFDAIRRTPRSVMRDEYEITDAIQVFIDDGNRVEAADVIECDVNLTTPRDVWRANMIHLDGQREGSLVHESAEVDPSATLERSVIGPGTRVMANVHVRRSVVLARSVVKEDVTGCVVTPHQAIEVEGSR